MDLDPAQIPWQASLGVAGVCVSGLVATLVWVIRQVVTGKFQSEAQVNLRITAITSSNDKLIELEHQRAEEAIAVERLGRSEWRETAITEQKARIEMTEIARAAVESNKITDHFYQSMPPRGLPSGDNGHERGGEG